MNTPPEGRDNKSSKMGGNRRRKKKQEFIPQSRQKGRESSPLGEGHWNGNDPRHHTGLGNSIGGGGGDGNIPGGEGSFEAQPQLPEKPRRNKHEKETGNKDELLAGTEGLRRREGDKKNGE